MPEKETLPVPQLCWEHQRSLTARISVEGGTTGISEVFRLHYEHNFDLPEFKPYLFKYHRIRTIRKSKIFITVS